MYLQDTLLIINFTNDGANLKRQTMTIFNMEVLFRKLLNLATLI